MTEAQCLKLLGLSTQAAARELKRAFRRQALVHHPDRNPDDPGAAERFLRITQAYQKLIAGGPFDAPRPAPKTAVTSAFGSRERDLAELVRFFTEQRTRAAFLDDISSRFAAQGVRLNRRFVTNLFAPGRAFSGRIHLHRRPGLSQPHWSSAGVRPPLMESLTAAAAAWTGRLVPATSDPGRGGNKG